MKKALLFSLVCFLGHAQAQEIVQHKLARDYAQSYAKGSWLIGLQAGYSKGLLLENNLSTQLYSGYFVTNKLLLGLSGSASQEGFKRVKELAFSIGPTVRFQLTRTRFSPFLAASYQFGQLIATGAESQETTEIINGQTVVVSGFRIQSSGMPQRMFSRSFAAGLSMGITPLLHVDLVLNWQDKVHNVDDGIYLSRGLYQPQVGINYRLGSKH